MEKMTRSRFAVIGLVVSISLSASLAFAQVDTASNLVADLPAPGKALTPAQALSLRFTFVRIQHTNQPRFGSTQVWATDWPEADAKFSRQLEAITGIPVEGALSMELVDPSLWSYPFIYLVEGGKLQLQDTEVAALRGYLNGGGFLLVDDFWGEHEWQQLAAELGRAFPDLEPVDLWPDHDVFHAFFDIEDKPRAPGFAAVTTGVGGENGASMDDAKIRGLIDSTGRLVAVFCHNMDLGDAWEHAEDDRYPREYSQGSLMLGINIVVHALTH